MPGSVTAACCSCGPIPARRRRWCSTPTTGHSPCSRAPASAAYSAAPCAHPRLCPLRQPQENHLMERTQLFDLMGELKLFGMKAAFDEIMATAVKRQHEPQRIVGVSAPIFACSDFTSDRSGISVRAIVAAPEQHLSNH